MTQLSWERTGDGSHQAHVVSSDDTVSRNWVIRPVASRTWAIHSTTIVRHAAPHTYHYPPVSIDGTYHGTAYTLREARELVASLGQRVIELQEA